MKKVNKYLYGWKLYVNYGQGWEYEIFEDSYKGYRENRKAYRENCDYPQKWTQGRELNPEYILLMQTKQAIQKAKSPNNQLPLKNPSEQGEHKSSQ